MRGSRSRPGFNGAGRVGGGSPPGSAATRRTPDERIKWLRALWAHNVGDIRLVPASANGWRSPFQMVP